MALFILIMAIIMVCAAIGFFIANYFLCVAEWFIALLGTIVMFSTIISIISGIIWAITLLLI